MSIKGGYKIIDLKDNDVIKNDVVIEGIYETIKDNYGKPLLISGIVIDGIKKDDVYTQVNKIGDYYTFTLYNYKLSVSNTNVVSTTRIPSYDFVINSNNKVYNGIIKNGYYQAVLSFESYGTFETILYVNEKENNIHSLSLFVSYAMDGTATLTQLNGSINRYRNVTEFVINDVMNDIAIEDIDALYITLYEINI